MWFIIRIVRWWWVRGRRHAVLCWYRRVPLVLASATTPNPTYGRVSTELILCASVCVVFLWEKHAHVYVQETQQGRWRDKNKGDHLKRKSTECDTERVCVCVCVCVCPHLCVFAIRQCVKMSRFDCRRFMSHKWWLTIHLPKTHTLMHSRKTHTHTYTHTHTHIQTYRHTHTSLPLRSSSTDREEYVQAALLMHIYTEHTHSLTYSAGTL